MNALVETPLKSASLLEQIVAASQNKDVDAEKMKAMANLALDLQKHEQQQQFNRDLAAAMFKMPRISKRNQIIIPANTQRNTAARVQGKFASWENIDAAIRPILAEHNLALRFKLRGDENGTYCTPILLHSNGWVEEGDELRVPPDVSGSKNAAQAIGSSSSYAKRYAACAALNIVTEDEDRDGTSYPLATDELNDRQVRLIAEANAAHGDGNYSAWWDKISPADKQFLIIRGIHAQLTGAPQLPGPRTVEDSPTPDNQIATDEESDFNRPEPEPEPERPKHREETDSSRKAMVDRYIAKVEACSSTDAVLVINEDPATKKWLSNLEQNSRPEWERATTASSRHFATLLAKEDKAGQGSLV